MTLWGVTFCGCKALDAYHEDNKFIVYADGETRELELSYSPNGYGGRQTFFLCPVCKERRRYLYYNGGGFVCRKCAKLNYRSQQEAKDSMRDFRKGMNYAKAHLDAFHAHYVDGFSFPAYIPGKPTGMHQSTYRRHLLRFTRYRERYTQRLIADLAKLGGLLGK